MSAAEPRRPSSAELVAQVAVAALHRAPSSEYETEITLNAKGDVQVRVSGKSDDTDKLAWVQTEFDRLCAAYPRRNGGEAA